MNGQFNIYELNLPALDAVNRKKRRVVLKLTEFGDFNIRWNRAQIPDKHTSWKLHECILVGSNKTTDGPPRPEEINSTVYDGDILYEINGKSVEQMSMAEVESIFTDYSQSELNLVVENEPELSHLMKHKTGMFEQKDKKGLFLEQSCLDPVEYDSIPEDERYWLVHGNGYSLCRLVERLDDGKVKVSLSNKEMIVESSDIDRTNPSTFDRSSDLSSLKYVNETSLIHVLRQRSGCNTEYTNAGTRCLVYCGHETKDEDTNLKSLANKFKVARRNQMQPHIFATAQQVLRNLQTSGRSQGVVFTGCSGSGKTSKLNDFLKYLSVSTGWAKNVCFDDCVNALSLINTLGSCQTNLNHYATKHLKLFSLFFDSNGDISGLKAETFLLDSDRLTKHIKTDQNFLIMPMFWFGISDEVKTKLKLDKIGDIFFANNDIEKHQQEWSNFVDTLKKLNFNADATQGDASRSNFVKFSSAQNAASLFQTTAEDLYETIFKANLDNKKSNVVSSSIMDRFKMSNKSQSGKEALNTFINGLYQHFFNSIVGHINTTFNSKNISNSITLVDSPGNNFNQAWIDGGKNCSSLSDFVYNYVSERIIEMNYDTNFTQAAEFYTNQQVDVELEKPLIKPQTFTRMCDTKEQTMNSADIQKRSKENKGILALLEEESMYPGGSDDGFIHRIFLHYEDTKLFKKDKQRHVFHANHGLNNFTVKYGVEGWVRQAQPSKSATVILPFLCKVTSKNKSLSAFFSSIIRLTVDSNVQKIRRATQVISAESGGLKYGSGYFSSIVSQTDTFINAISRMNSLFFVNCISPFAKSPDTLLKEDPRYLNTRLTTNSMDTIDVPFVRYQIRSILLLDTIRAHNKGFPERILFKDFKRRFNCLTNQKENLTTSLDDRAGVKEMFDRLEIYQHMYRLGLSHVLLRSEVINTLEEQRDVCLSGKIVYFQRACKAYLWLKDIKKNELKNAAMQVIQRNSSKYLATKNDAWVKLYFGVKPLVELLKTEYFVTENQDKLNQCKLENSQYKSNVLKMEGRIAELEQMIHMESQNNQDLSNALEREHEEKVNLHNELQSLQQLAKKSSIMTQSATSLSSSQNGLPEVVQNEVSNEVMVELNKLRDSEYQYKSVIQKLKAEIEDSKVELEMLYSRNIVLQKKQESVDTLENTYKQKICLLLSDKDAMSRHKSDLCTSNEKNLSEIQALKNENSELRLNASKLRKDLDELSTSTSSKGNSEIAVTEYVKNKREMEDRMAELEDELDESLTKNDVLQQSVTRLMMQIEKSKNDNVREVEQKEIDLDELRSQFQRRQRTFEDQIAELHASNKALINQNRVLDGKVRNLEQDHTEAQMLHTNYKSDYKKLQALLMDKDALLAYEKDNSPAKNLIFKLKEMLIDAERRIVITKKSNTALELELSDMRSKLENALTAKNIAEERISALKKEAASTENLLHDNEDQISNLTKKLKAQVQQNKSDNITIIDQLETISDLVKNKKRLEDALSEITSTIEFHKHNCVDKHKYQILEHKIKEIESKCELEIIQKAHLESINIKQKDSIENLVEQLESCQESLRKEQLILSIQQNKALNFEEEISMQTKRELEFANKRQELELELEVMDAANQMLKRDLKFSDGRVNALKGVLDKHIDTYGDSEDEFDDAEEEDGFLDESDLNESDNKNI
uniref:Myosin motor domain-containing protein n=1 Tax=Rhabditophanes sp. KR3021 TaxID=114890 RepID=A0AC35U7Q3_9BILA